MHYYTGPTKTHKSSNAKEKNDSDTMKSYYWAAARFHPVDMHIVYILFCEAIAIQEHYFQK